MKRFLFVFVLALHHPILAQEPPSDPYGLTAYRPQHGVGYRSFTRTAVPDHLEDHHILGPGIRVNHAEEQDFGGEDDLIEVEVVISQPSADATFVLERSDNSLSVWRTRTKDAQTALTFTDGRYAQLSFNDTDHIRLWVEWTGAVSAVPVLSLRALGSGSDVLVDRIVFHAFAGLVVALGGMKVATALYESGWDVLSADAREVKATGYGGVYTEVVNAIRNRSVRELAIIGYSRGGGSTYALCMRLNEQRADIGTFSIEFTSYVDAIRNHWATWRPEERRPPTTRFHANHYQRHIFSILMGGPVADSRPSPTGLRVDTMTWGSEADHWNIDDLEEVQDFIYAELTARVSR